MGKNQIKQKHVPMRTCIATSRKMSKKDLVRIVQDPETLQFVIDLKSKIRARGANISPDLGAFDLMVKKKALKRALKLEKDLTVEQYKDLRIKFENALEEKSFRPDNKPVVIRVKQNILVAPSSNG